MWASLSDLLGVDVRRPFRPVEVRALDADDDALVLHRHVGRRLDFHVLEVLLDLARPHACAHDVEEGEHARLLVVDDAGLEVFEVAPSGRAGVGHGGDARAQREAVRLESPRAAGVGVLHQARIDVDVDIDQARRDVKAGGVHGLDGARCRDVGGDGGDFAVLDRDVAHGAELVLAVDDVAALDEQVVVGLREGGGRKG